VAEKESGGKGKWRKRKVAEKESGGKGKWRKRKVVEKAEWPQQDAGGEERVWRSERVEMREV